MSRSSDKLIGTVGTLELLVLFLVSAECFAPTGLLLIKLLRGSRFLLRILT